MVTITDGNRSEYNARCGPHPPYWPHWIRSDERNTHGATRLGVYYLTRLSDESYLIVEDFEDGGFSLIRWFPQYDWWSQRDTRRRWQGIRLDVDPFVYLMEEVL